MTDTENQTAAFLIDDRLKTHRKPGAGVTLVTQSPNDALGMKEEPNQTARLERSMTAGEIEAATEHPDVDWGFIEIGPRPVTHTIWLRLKLWASIVGCEWHASRIGPFTAWRFCSCIHPWREMVKLWGVIDDRR